MDTIKNTPDSARTRGRGKSAESLVPAHTLAARITLAHRAALGAAQTAIEHARRAGELLLEAKATTQHGQWLPWLAEHCPEVGARQAQKYMRLVSGWPAIEPNANCDSYLTIDGALELIATPKDGPLTAGDDVPLAVALLRFRRLVQDAEHEAASTRQELALLDLALSAPHLSVTDAAAISTRAEAIESAWWAGNVHALAAFGDVLNHAEAVGWADLMRELVAAPEAIPGFLLMCESRTTDLEREGSA